MTSEKRNPEIESRSWTSGNHVSSEIRLQNNTHGLRVSCPSLITYPTPSHSPQFALFVCVEYCEPLLFKKCALMARTSTSARNFRRTLNSIHTQRRMKGKTTWKHSLGKWSRIWYATFLNVRVGGNRRFEMAFFNFFRMVLWKFLLLKCSWSPWRSLHPEDHSSPPRTTIDRSKPSVTINSYHTC